MNATVKTKDLLNACIFAGSVVKSRTTLQALTHVRLTAGKGEISVFGSNLEIFKTQRCPADVHGGFDVGLPATLLIAFLRSIPTEQVEMIVEKDSVLLKAGSVRATIAHIPGAEFPDLPKVDGQEVVIAADELKGHLRKAVHAAHTDTIGNREKCAVWAQFDNNRLHFTSFDGCRVATTSLDARGKGEFIITTELVNEVLSVDEPNHITVLLGESHAMFSGETWEIRGKLVDAKVPNWRALDRYKFDRFAKIDRDAITDSLRRVLIFTPSNPNLNNSTVADFDGQNLTLRLKRMNEIVETIPCSGPKMKFSCNPEHLLKAISFVESDEVKIGLIDELSPLQISDGDYRVLTMPYRQ